MTEVALQQAEQRRRAVRRWAIALALVAAAIFFGFIFLAWYRAG